MQEGRACPDAIKGVDEVHLLEPQVPYWEAGESCGGFHHSCRAIEGSDQKAALHERQRVSPRSTPGIEDRTTARYPFQKRRVECRQVQMDSPCNVLRTLVLIELR